MAAGPLNGLRIVEFAGLGPVPFCGMLFADLGAEIIRIDRPGHPVYNPDDVTTRGRKSITLDLKNPAAQETALRMIESADILTEGFRPGVMERLGLGPDVVLKRNPKIVYGRMTGWGQTGPKANEPGHDINYIALAGALHAIGTKQQPIIPANFVGDFGGGSLYLAFGVLAALFDAKRQGVGQVVDCSMVDGVASLMGMAYGRMSAGIWLDERESNTIDGGSHFYNVYQCADDLWIAIGPVELKFYHNLLDGLGITDHDAYPQRERALWPQLREKFATIFKTKTREQWIEVFDGREACVTPVLSMSEAPKDPHNIARQTFVEIDGVIQPSHAPKFSSMPQPASATIATLGEHNKTALLDWGFSSTEISTLQEKGALGE